MASVCRFGILSVMSSLFQSTHTVPKTELVGEQIRFVKDGSNVKMHCVVRGALEPPIYISWFYGTKQIYNDSPRGWKIKLDRNVLDNEHDGSHNSVSTGVMKGLNAEKITCAPANRAGGCHKNTTYVALVAAAASESFSALDRRIHPVKDNGFGVSESS